MIEMIENQVYLAQGAYTKVIGRSEGQLTACKNMHYELVRIHLLIQTAAAYEMIEKRIQAQNLLLLAVQEAASSMVPSIYMCSSRKSSLSLWVRMRHCASLLVSL